MQCRVQLLRRMLHKKYASPRPLLVVQRLIDLQRSAEGSASCSSEEVETALLNGNLKMQWDLHQVP